METSIRDLYTPEENQRYLKSGFVLGNMRSRTCQNHNWFYDFASLLEDLNGSLGEEIRELDDIKEGSYDNYLLKIVDAKSVVEQIRHYKEMSKHYSLDDDEDLREAVVANFIQGAEKHAKEGNKGFFTSLIGHLCGAK